MDWQGSERVGGGGIGVDLLYLCTAPLRTLILALSSSFRIMLLAAFSSFCASLTASCLSAFSCIFVRRSSSPSTLESGCFFRTPSSFSTCWLLQERKERDFLPRETETAGGETHPFQVTPAVETEAKDFGG